MKALRILTAAAAILAAAASQAETMTYAGSPRGSAMKISGTSTMHDWTVESLVIGGFIEVDSNFPLDPSKEPPKDAKLTPKVDVRIPVRQIKSGKSLMDTVMHGAMKAEEHPWINYALTEMTVKGKEGDGLKFATTGVIKCAGQSKTNSFDVIMTKVDDKTLKFSGTTKLKMSDFGITPPAPKIALGAIKTGDDVVLNFEWVTKQKAPAAAAAPASAP